MTYFVENIIYFLGSVCVFLRVTLLKLIVLCRILRFNTDCWFTLLVQLFVLEILKKGEKKL